MGAFSDKLQEMGACREALAWIGDRTAQQAWDECQRGDWMLWLASRLIDQPNGPTQQQVGYCACECAERLMRYAPTSEDRTCRAVEAARAYTRSGNMTTREIFISVAAYMEAYVSVKMDWSASATWVVESRRQASIIRSMIPTIEV